MKPVKVYTAGKFVKNKKYAYKSDDDEKKKSATLERREAENIMRRGRTKPLFKPFPKSSPPKWSKQVLFSNICNKNQDYRSPWDEGDSALYGDSRSLYGIATYSSQS